jgi:hypothetical protein
MMNTTAAATKCSGDTQKGIHAIGRSAAIASVAETAPTYNGVQQQPACVLMHTR